MASYISTIELKILSSEVVFFFCSQLLENKHIYFYVTAQIITQLWFDLIESKDNKSINLHKHVI